MYECVREHCINFNAQSVGVTLLIKLKLNLFILIIFFSFRFHLEWKNHYIHEPAHDHTTLIKSNKFHHLLAMIRAANTYFMSIFFLGYFYWIFFFQTFLCINGLMVLEIRNTWKSSLIGAIVAFYRIFNQSLIY